MAKISAIKQQVKRTGRVSVYLDGRYSFSLARDQLVQLGLKVGQELKPPEVNRLKTDMAYGKLRDLVYKWLSLRSRSEYEINEYLRKKTDDEDLKKRIVEELKLYNYVDDNKFSEMWIRNRRLLKPVSKYRLRQELLQKRVPQEIIAESLDSAKLDDLAAAKAVIARRGQRYADQQKLMAYLARQGFSYDVIKRALAD
ncbi:MAG TPA: RecX family transcriptional regulator [Candidatus Saccharimonadales bacterium]